jgi:hypothetical protein
MSQKFGFTFLILLASGLFWSCDDEDECRTELYCEAVAIIMPAKTNRIGFPGKSNKDSYNRLVDELSADKVEHNIEALEERLESISNIGNDVEIDRLLQIFESRVLKDSITKRHGFKADFEGQVSFERTKEGAIKVQVMHKKPGEALDICNSVLQLVSILKSDILKERGIEVVEQVEQKYNALSKEIDQLNDTLLALNNLGVVSPSAQGPLMEAFATTSDPKLKAELKKKIKVNEEYGSLFNDLSHLKELKRERLSELERVSDRTKGDANINLSHIFIVEEPTLSKAKVAIKFCH